MVPAHCEVTAYRDEQELMIVLTGILRLDNCDEVKAYLKAALDQGPSRLFLLLGRLQEIDSAGLGVLVGLHITARKHKAELSLLSPTAMQANLLKMTRLDQVLAIHTGIEAEEIRARLEVSENEIDLRPATS